MVTRSNSLTRTQQRPQVFLEEVVWGGELAPPINLWNLLRPRHVMIPVLRKVTEEILGMGPEMVGIWKRDRPVAGTSNPVELRNGAPVHLVRKRLIPGVEQENHVRKLFSDLGHQGQKRLHIRHSRFFQQWGALALVGATVIKHPTLSEHANEGEIDLGSHHLADREEGLPRHLVVPTTSSRATRAKESER